jgi:serine O-acetyltransferase
MGGAHNDPMSPKSRKAIEPTHHADLEKAIDAVATSYDTSLEINNLASAALPNRRAVISAFNHIKHAIYLGFYSTRSLNRANVRYTIAEHLYPAFEILVEQISRVLLYEQITDSGRVAREKGWAENVVQRLFDNLPEIRTRLNGDVLAAYDGDPAAKSVEEIVFSYPALAAITAYRVAHHLHQEEVPMIPRIISEFAHSETGIDIHPGATIGDRLFIDHGTGVVIGETCVIGNNVKMYQGVTLGALSLPRSQRGEILRGKRRHPTLEDDVTIYSGATILGGDTVIGAGSVIGGNVWLVESIPAGSKVTYQPGSADERNGMPRRKTDQRGKSPKGRATRRKQIRRPTADGPDGHP